MKIYDFIIKGVPIVIKLNFSQCNLLNNHGESIEPYLLMGPSAALGLGLLCFSHLFNHLYSSGIKIHLWG